MTSTGTGSTGSPAPLRIGFVPGVTPGKWLRTWEERMPPSPLVASMVPGTEGVAMLREGALDMCFVRLPVDRDGLHLITLYAEVQVVVLPKEHELTLLESVTLEDLADELVLVESAELTIKQAIETVAAGTGVVVVPMSLARLHHRKDVETRPVTDLAPTDVGLAWLVGNADPRLDTFIGVVRGRTARSSREAATTPAPKKKPVPKTTPKATKRASKRVQSRQRRGRGRG